MDQSMTIFSPFHRTIFVAAVTTTLLASCAADAQEEQTEKMNDNVLLKQWIGPYGGVPPWRQVNQDDFLPAFEAAIKLSADEIEKIADNPNPPNFENTIVALEKAGKTLDRLATVFGVHSSNLNLGSIPDIEREVRPKLSKHNDSIVQNKQLFQRIAAVYESDEMKQLTHPQQRLVEDYYKDFVRQGAKLNSDDKLKLSQMNAELAGLFTQFSQNVLKDESLITVVNNESQLDGLPPSLKDAMAAAAAEYAKENPDADPPKFVINNTRSSMEPVLTYANDRSLREKVWRTYYNRGDNGDDRDNNEIITRILKLRAERALLLGYPTHAHWRLEPQMAKTPENAMALMLKVWPKAVARVREEVADMQKVADEEGANITIQPWDYRYYAEKVRKAKYDLDFADVKPYLQMDKLRDGMMWAAGQLYGFNFKQVNDVPAFHPDVTVWEVTRDGEHVGLWFFDPYARRGKRSGAWMNAYRSQENIDAPITPIVSNNSNFIKGKPGEPVLISWDDAVTLFHEFGHALHGYVATVGTRLNRERPSPATMLNFRRKSTNTGCRRPRFSKSSPFITKRGSRCPKHC
jgi:peptidyl-dipeptidase Dcp